MTSAVKFLRGCPQCSQVFRRNDFVNSVAGSTLPLVSAVSVKHRKLSVSSRLLITPKRNVLPPPPLLQPELLPPRPGDTYMVERLWQLPPGPDGGRPERAQMNELYKLLKVTEVIKYPADMPCILTDFVDGVGIRGDLVTVKRDLFHNELFPGGLAVYASPENIQDFEDERKAAGIEKAESRLGVLARMTVKELNHMNLEIPLRADVDWKLNKNHVQIAFRLQGVDLDLDCIEIPEDDVTEFGEVAVTVKINGLESIEMTATILPILEKFPPSKKSPFKL